MTLPEERCETCRFYKFQFIHKCMIVATAEYPEMYSKCPADCKCPRYEKGTWERPT